MAALRGLLAGLAVLLAVLPRVVAAQAPVVDRADLEGEINSVMAAYLHSEVQRAAADRAQALVIVMNTPGGESTAMDDIITTLLNSPVPVIVYVSPPGARAASAGLFVAQAADLVAMAPGTNIGSAHPIAGNGTNLTGDLGLKVLNDAVARVRDLATSHGRNADWAEQAVRQSVNVGADEAVRLHVADLVAPSMAGLLAAVDGRVLQRPHEPVATLSTAGATVVDHPMPLLQQILHLITDPNIAYLLLLVAVFGLIAEVSSPGAILPGTVGGIAAVLALVALSGLPLNLAGVLLVFFAFLLFVADIKAPSHGILTAGGVVALVIGSAFLIDTGAVGTPVDPRLILASAVVALLLFGFVVRKAIQARSQSAATGAAGMLGALGEAREPMAPEGNVFVAGRVWLAVTAGTLPRGATVRVVGNEGELLRVEAAYPAAAPPAVPAAPAQSHPVPPSA
jgi:membrane-bound serine protease (ClpP class)